MTPQPLRSGPPHPSARLAAVLACALIAVSTGCRLRTEPQADPCDPNPCTEANRTTCVNQDDEPRCVCDEGFVSRPNGSCEPVSALNCPEHAGDASEPDDCMASAKELLPGADAREQSIDPTGDYDFITFMAAAGHVYQVDVAGDGALYPRLDVYDGAGVWRSVAELTPSEDPLRPVDLRKPRLFFKHAASTPGRYYVRVAHSPLDPSYAIGGYSIAVKDTGLDDHGDGAGTATTLTPSYVSDPATITIANFEYPGDQDWFRFDASTSQEYLLLFDTTLMRPGFALYKSGSSQPVLNRQEWENYFTVPSDGSYLLQLYDANGTGGAYRFSFQRQPRQ